MLYREAGQFKTSYASDQAIFPILQDRVGILIILVIAFIGIPVTGNDFLINAVMIPFLIFSLAAIGLNLLTGYTGLLSLGTGAFMGVGAYACYKLTTVLPDVNIIIWVIVSGFFSAAVGAVFGLPSLRIKGFYLAIATLAAQFFLEWCFIRIPWLYNYNVSAAIEVPQRELFGIIDYRPARQRADALPNRAHDRRGNDVDGVEHRPWAHRSHVDGDPRYGYCCRTHGYSPAAHQTARFRGVIILLRCGWGDAGVSLVWRCGIDCVLDQ